MSFTSSEKEILEIAYQTFITKEFALKLYSKKHSSAGFEAWVVGELLVQLEIRNMNPVKKQEPDLIVDNIKIEIKGCAHSEKTKSAEWLIVDYVNHAGSDILHLFVFSYNDNLMDHLIDFLNLNNIIYEKMELRNSGWMVMISKKTLKTPTSINPLPYRAWAKNKMCVRVQ